MISNLSILSKEAYAINQSKHSCSILYGIHPTPFGSCLITVLDNQICGLYFLVDESKESEKDALLAEVSSNWDLSPLLQDQASTQQLVEAIFAKTDPLPLVVKGTPFQSKVWRALLSVTSGKVSHYEALAFTAGYPEATRAVAHAVASNPISILIPCHRIIYKSGKIGKYRWGASLKKRLLEWEGFVS